jgi:hypothetical protein
VILTGFLSLVLAFARTHVDAPDVALKASGVNCVGMEMVLAGAADQRGRHGGGGHVYVSSREVTDGQWRAIMKSGPFGGAAAGDLPRRNASRRSIERFCEKLSLMDGREYRLPTPGELARVGSDGNPGGGFRVACVTGGGHVFFDDAPKTTHRPTPHYRRLEKTAVSNGIVLLELVVGADGAPESVTALSGSKLFSDAALDWYGKWRFRPAMVQGAPVRARLLVYVDCFSGIRSINFQAAGGVVSRLGLHHRDGIISWVPNGYGAPFDRIGFRDAPIRSFMSPPPGSAIASL